MKKLIFAATSLLAAGAAMAADAPSFTYSAFSGSAPAVQPAKIPNWPAAANPFDGLTFDVGVTVHREQYREYMGDSKVMQETANMPGLKLGVARKFDDGAVLSADAIYAQGHSTYTGSYQDGSYGDLQIHNLGRSYFESNVRYKMTSPKWSQTALITGLGYRQLTDHLDDAGPGGYRRVNRRVYAILGVERPFQVSQAWSITPRLETKIILLGRQSVDLFGGTTLNQHGYGAELAADFTYHGYNNNRDIIITPFVRGWKLGQSNSSNGMVEPKNTTTEAGLNFTVRF